MDCKLTIGFQINSAQTNFPNNEGFRIELRRIRSADDTPSFSLYGNDIDEITFEVNYHSDNTLGIAVIKILLE